MTDQHLDPDAVGSIAAELYAKHPHLDGARDQYMVLHLAIVYALMDGLRDTLGERYATDGFLKLLAMALRYEAELLITPRARQGQPSSSGGALDLMRSKR